MGIKKRKTGKEGSAPRHFPDKYCFKFYITATVLDKERDDYLLR